MKTFKEMIYSLIQDKKYEGQMQRLERLLLHFGFEKDLNKSNKTEVLLCLPKNPFDIYVEIFISIKGYVDVWYGEHLFDVTRFSFEEHTPEQIFDMVYNHIENKISTYY